MKLSDRSGGDSDNSVAIASPRTAIRNKLLERASIPSAGPGHWPQLALQCSLCRVCLVFLPFWGDWLQRLGNLNRFEALIAP